MTVVLAATITLTYDTESKQFTAVSHVQGNGENEVVSYGKTTEEALAAASKGLRAYKEARAALSEREKIEPCQLNLTTLK